MANIIDVDVTGKVTTYSGDPNIIMIEYLTQIQKDLALIKAKLAIP